MKKILEDLRLIMAEDLKHDHPRVISNYEKRNAALTRIKKALTISTQPSDISDVEVKKLLEYFRHLRPQGRTDGKMQFQNKYNQFIRLFSQLESKVEEQNSILKEIINEVGTNKSMCIKWYHTLYKRIQSAFIKDEEVT